MDDFAKQLRTLASLYTNRTINLQERDAQRTQRIARPLHMTDMKKDLEAVHALYNESAITRPERDTLKQKLLELDAGKKSSAPKRGWDRLAGLEIAAIRTILPESDTFVSCAERN